MQLVFLSCNSQRPYALCRLKSAAESGSTSVQRLPSFASRTALPVIAAQCMKAVCRDAPWVLARAVLACGGHVAPLSPNTGHRSAFGRQEKVNQGLGHQIPAGGVLPWPQIQALVQYALELILLTTALGTECNAREAEGNGTIMINVKKLREVTILFAYVLTVSAAWLGRRPKALLLLVGPTLGDSSSSPEHLLVQFDAAAWEQYAETAEPITPEGASANSAIDIAEDDVWRILGVALWSHVLSYSKKQLSGTSKELSYSSYGRVSQSHSPVQKPRKSQQSNESPIRSPPASPGKHFNPFGWVLPPSSPTFKAQATEGSMRKSAAQSDELAFSEDNRTSTELKPTSISVSEFSADPSIPLISSVACIAAGLRAQLASHMADILESSADSPLVAWLWGRPIQLVHGITEESVSSSDGLAHDQFVTTPKTEAADKQACTQLWKLLVSREQVLSALSLQGVVGPSYAVYTGETPAPENRGRGPGSGSGTSAGRSNRSGSSSISKDDEGSSGNGKMTGEASKDSPPLEITPDGVVERLVGSSYSPQARNLFSFQAPEEIFHLNGELFEVSKRTACVVGLPI